MRKVSHRVCLQIFLYVLAIGVFGISAVAQGMRDTTFGANISKGPAQGFVSELLPDGDLLVGGAYTTVDGQARYYLARLDGTTGSLEPGFAVGQLNGDVVAILVQPDGKVVIGGSFTTYNGATANRLIRLNADGSRDGSFGGTGVAGPSYCRITSIIQQASGKIVAIGQGVTGYDGGSSFGIFRANTNGSFDPTFVSGFNAIPGLEELAQQSDGKIIMTGGFTGYGGVTIQGVLRMNQDGAIDTGFNTGGAGVNGSVAAGALQPDGKIVIGGSFSQYNGAATQPIIRLLSNGVLDGSFAPPSLPMETNYIESIAIQSDGMVVAAGAFNYAGGRMKPAIRLNTFGSLDAGYALGNADNLAYDATLASNGAVILTGWF
ncbi:MAG: hypothetical protein R2682_16000, partial [Pyrinomonadaceae bacterium]